LLQDKNPVNFKNVLFELYTHILYSLNSAHLPSQLLESSANRKPGEQVHCGPLSVSAQ